MHAQKCACGYSLDALNIIATLRRAMPDVKVGSSIKLAFIMTMES
jgi:hypothetical protein